MTHKDIELDDIWDDIWRDKKGRVVVYQHPNFFLIGWLILTIVSLFVTGNAGNIIWYIALVVLTVWSGLEIFRGVNYFRRALGLLVLLLIVAALLKVGY